MIIEVKQASKVIGKTQVLNSISFTMSSGYIYGLSGINGSGKTMLMRLIAGLIRLSEGEIVVDGKRLGKDFDFPPATGMLLENPSFLDSYTGLENLMMLAFIQKRIRKEGCCNAMERVGLEATDPRKYRKYSLGMKQKLGIAAAIMEMPDLLLLDEPFNALDKRSFERVRSIILEEKKRGAVVILASHEPGVLEDLSDELIVLEDGRIIEHKKIQ